jgi:hypothetical protein
MSCSGNLRVSDSALLSMLGTGRFKKNNNIVSNEELEIAKINSKISDSGGNMGVASSSLGIKKSSLKRRILSKETKTKAFDELFSTNSTRRYLERTAGSWRVLNLDARSSEACVEMTGGPTKVMLSVKLNISNERFSRET